MGNVQKHPWVWSACEWEGKIMGEQEIIKVIIADDHAAVRSGLGAFIMAFDDLECLGEASNGQEAIDLCEKTNPDVVLMDLMMPVMNGVTATRIMHERWPQLHIIALTSFKEKELVEGALKAGAISYLLKDVSAEELATAIREAMAGQSKISADAARILEQKSNED
jgi:two-component system, NarL family, response regulator LiaR